MMINRKWLYISLLSMSLLLSSCNTLSNANVKCVDVSDALKTSIEILGSVDNGVEVRLVFTNSSMHPLRIYYIDVPLFNRSVNRFYIVDSKGKKVFDTTEVPPHGVIISEKDFYLISPYSKKVFKEKISLAFKNTKQLGWLYHNKITSWKGNFETLDGKEKVLFNGNKIPYIWTGNIESNTQIQ